MEGDSSDAEKKEGEKKKKKEKKPDQGPSAISDFPQPQVFNPAMDFDFRHSQSPCPVSGSGGEGMVGRPWIC